MVDIELEYYYKTFFYIAWGLCYCWVKASAVAKAVEAVEARANYFNYSKSDAAKVKAGQSSNNLNFSKSDEAKVKA